MKPNKWCAVIRIVIMILSVIGVDLKGAMLKAVFVRILITIVRFTKSPMEWKIHILNMDVGANIHG